jgi:microsomal epoxide hydrolase
MTYSPPSSAKPFNLNVPDNDLSEWRQLLQLSKLGPTTYENTQTKENYGVTKEWVSSTKDYWLNKYDWRAEEKRINSFNNFKMQIESIDMHFIGLFSEKRDAIPIVFIHGWPGSFIEFLPMLEVVKNQFQGKELPYHFIVPSLPGYTLSTGLPTDKNWTMHDSARIIHTLMKNLGFNKYLAQGGDVGSFESRILAHTYDECVGIHRMPTSHSLHMPSALTDSSQYASRQRHTRRIQTHRIRKSRRSPRRRVAQVWHRIQHRARHAPLYNRPRPLV